MVGNFYQSGHTLDGFRRGTALLLSLSPALTQQVSRDQEVVVVNLDNSQFSRRLERMVEATPQVRLSARAHSLEEAAEVKFSRMIMSGQSPTPAAEQQSAIKLNLVPVFNPTMGYVNYVIPAIFILILHQTLIMGVGILGGGQNEAQPTCQEGYWQRAAPLQLLVVRTGFLSLSTRLLFMYYFGFSFTYYNIPRLAEIGELTLLHLPFLLSATFLGICLGSLLPRRELATLLVIISSMPLIFAPGFIWPISAIPATIVTASQVFPVIPAIQAFVALNQMGAEFSDILPYWQQLWLCTVPYGALAWWLLRKRLSVHSVAE